MSGGMTGVHHGMAVSDFLDEPKRPLDEIYSTHPTKKPTPKTTDPVPPWSELLYDYTQTATLHGIRYTTARGTFLIRKIVWFLFVAGAVSFFIYYFYDRISLYLSYPKNVNVEVNYLSKVKFPPVTFCNQNTFRLTAAADNDWYSIVKALATAGTTTAAITCEDFLCASGDECALNSQLCDLFPDCNDGSDEINCDVCPLLVVDGSSALLASYPHVFGQEFELQTTTYKQGTRAFYTTVGNLTTAYLYYDGDHWAAGQLFADTTEVLFSAPTNQTSPDKVTEGWNAAGGGVNITVTCKTKNMDLVPEPEKLEYGSLTLETLYRTTGHTKGVFVESCLWKGKNCIDSVTETLTDLGVCYTFKDSDMFIEQSGPGYGLIMTLNIEYYEYTLAGDAAGIKLLLHQDADVPIVSERGVALSPGLYSFISVESTQVENLAPPYGTCGEPELSFYSAPYSIAKCKMELETKYVDSKCGCRDFHQPTDASKKPDVCPVSDYVSCAKGNLAEMKASGNYSDCLTPCLQEEYVPTTSFAILLKADGSDMEQDKRNTLTQALFKARETSYRVDQTKYMDTLREFHVLSERMKTLDRFLTYTLSNLQKEYDTLYTLGATITFDCIWVREELRTARQSILDHAIEPLHAFTDAVRGRVYHTWLELDNIVQDTRTKYGQLIWSDPNYATRAQYRTFREEHVRDFYFHVFESLLVHRGGQWRHWWDADDEVYDRWQNSTSGKEDYREDQRWKAWRLYHHLYESLNLCLEHQRQSQQVDDMPTSNIRLKNAMLDPLSELISRTCTWCVDNTDILQNVEGRIQSTINSVRNDLNTQRTQISNWFWEYLDGLSVLDGNIWVQGNYSQERNSINNRFNTIINNIDSRMDELLQSPLYLNHLLDFQWLLHCQAKTGISIEDYRGQDVQLVALLKDFQKYIKQEADKWDTWAENYRLNTQYVTGQTLDAFKNFPFDEIVAYSLRQQTRLESALNDRLQIVDELKTQFSSINYILMAVIEQNYLEATSEYWRKFSIVNPGYQPPNSTTLQYGGVVPETYFGIDLNAIEKTFWDNTETNLNDTKNNMQVQIEALVDDVRKAQTYITTFVTGNQLGQSFFSENFLQVEIFYKELTERKVSQQKAYDFQNLLSEIGGLMGLLMGASVLTIAEVFDLFVYNSFRKAHARHSRTHPSGRPT